MGAFDIAEKHFKSITPPSTDTTSGAISEDIEAWRICRAWKRILGVTLNPKRVASHLKQIDFHKPTPLIDGVLADCENQSKSAPVEEDNKEVFSSDGDNDSPFDDDSREPRSDGGIDDSENPFA